MKNRYFCFNIQFCENIIFKHKIDCDFTLNIFEITLRTTYEEPHVKFSSLKNFI